MTISADSLVSAGFAVGPAHPGRKHWGEFAGLYSKPEMTLEFRLGAFRSGQWRGDWVLVQPQPAQPGFRRFVGFDLDLDEQEPSPGFWDGFWRHFRKVFGAPERYVQVRTPSGGLHVWVPLSGGEVSNREFCPSLQIRGRGGLLMCPPSVGLVDGRRLEWVFVDGQDPVSVGEAPAFPAEVFERFFVPYEKLRRSDDRSAGRHDALRRDLFRVFCRVVSGVGSSGVEAARGRFLESGLEVVSVHEQRNGCRIDDWEGYSAGPYLEREWDRMWEKHRDRVESMSVRIADGRIVADLGDDGVWPLLWFSTGIEIESVSVVSVCLLSDGLQPQSELFLFHTSRGPAYLPAADVSTPNAFNRAAAGIKLLYASKVPAEVNPFRVPLVPFLRDVLYSLSEGTEQVQVPSGAYDLDRHPMLQSGFAERSGLVWVSCSSDVSEPLSGYTGEICRQLFGSDIQAGVRASDRLEAAGMVDWLRLVLGFHRPGSVVRMAAASLFALLRGAFRDLAPGFQCPVVWVIGPSGSAKDKGAMAELRDLAGCVHGATAAVCRRAMFTARHGFVMHNEVSSIARSSWEELLLYSSDETPMTVFGQKPGTLSSTLLLVGESIPTWCSGTAMEERRFIVPLDRVQDRRSFIDPSRAQLADFGLIAGGGVRFRRLFALSVFELFRNQISRMPLGLSDYLNRTQAALYDGFSTRSGSIDTAMHLCARLFLYLASGSPVDVDPLDVGYDPEIEVAPGHSFRFMSSFDTGIERRRHGEEIWDSALVQLMALLEQQRTKLNVHDSCFVDPPAGMVTEHRVRWSFHLGSNPWVRVGPLAEDGARLWGNRRPFSAESLGVDVSSIWRAYRLDPPQAKFKNGVSYRRLPEQFALDFRAWFESGIEEIDEEVGSFGF